MQDTQILSAFHESGPPRLQGPVVIPFVFDACQLGVILRAVLFVELAAGVVVMFGSSSASDWAARLALVTSASLPATLVWILAACLSKRLLHRLSSLQQYLAAVGLGALAGLYGCWVLSLVNFSWSMPWVASACSGALVSVVLVLGLVMRAKGRMPADTAARLTELQSRIRPHFLFNTLNSTIALVRAEPAKAEAMLEDLSDLFRHALVDLGQSVTLQEEVALARRYLAIEQVRFGDRLRVQWSLDSAANAARLPPLLLQPLVENAVRHGVEPSDSGADIKISTEVRGGKVVIKVTNTVPAGPGPQGQGLALRNVHERLRLLHDVRSNFRSGLVEGVFQVRMELPL